MLYFGPNSQIASKDECAPAQKWIGVIDVSKMDCGWMSQHARINYILQQKKNCRSKTFTHTWIQNFSLATFMLKWGISKLSINVANQQRWLIPPRSTFWGHPRSMHQFTFNFDGARTSSFWSFINYSMEMTSVHMTMVRTYNSETTASLYAGYPDTYVICQQSE